eukprot:TRINITY_DN972_c0_g1_i1.p1 TRINITY_DN972_c0_g1~~TRINITY_DN972_c0_g1_i1.p1  ORF type:complete len:224 (+),score=27.65 TRINITY_DN972_c0_g1_i1:94-765(+)
MSVGTVIGHSSQRFCIANGPWGVLAPLRSAAFFKDRRFSCRFARSRGNICVRHSSRGENAESETSEKVLSGEWPESFSMLNFEDLTSYLEPTIFKPDAHPSAFLGDVMSKKVYTARVDQLLEEIEHYFQDFTGLPVIDNNIKCIGVISKKDKQKASKGLKSTVGEVMSSPAITLRPEMTVLDAASTMLKNKIHSIPIVNKEYDVIGIVTRTDIFNALEEGLPG